MSMGVILGLVSVIGIILAGINKELGTFAIEWNVALATFTVEVLVTVKLALASGVDKWFHKKGVETPLNFKVLDKEYTQRRYNNRLFKWSISTLKVEGSQTARSKLNR